MQRILGIDHVAFAADDLEATCALYRTIGGADICLHWSGTIEAAMDLLRMHKIQIIEGALASAHR